MYKWEAACTLPTTCLLPASLPPYPPLPLHAPRACNVTPALLAGPCVLHAPHPLCTYLLLHRTTTHAVTRYPLFAAIMARSPVLDLVRAWRAG